jgi:hypothetical protein
VGSGVIKRLANDLGGGFPDMKGLSPPTCSTCRPSPRHGPAPIQFLNAALEKWAAWTCLSDRVTPVARRTRPAGRTGASRVRRERARRATDHVIHRPSIVDPAVACQPDGRRDRPMGVDPVAT